MKSKEWKDFDFELLGNKWKVHFADEMVPREAKENEYLLGNCSYVNGTIIVFTKDTKGEKLSDDLIRINLLHEMTHAILGTGNYCSCNDDEPLVEWIARCLNSLIIHNVFDYAK